MKGVSRFGEKGKLKLRYVGLFKILEWIKNLAYRLALPLKLAHIHDVFHVPMLKKYELDLVHMLDVKEIEVDDKVGIVDGKEQMSRNKAIPLVKILW